MENIRVMSSDEEIKVFSDPFRLKIISAYKKADKPMTAKAIADKIGAVPSKVHYHVKKLVAVDILVLDHIESINGIQAKFYKLTADDFKLELKASADKDVVASQTVKVFDAVLDEFKSVMHTTAGHLLKEDKQPRGQGTFLTSEELYLDDDQALALMKDITDLVNKYKKRSSKDQVHYKGLFSMVENIEKDG